MSEFVMVKRMKKYLKSYGVIPCRFIRGAIEIVWRVVFCAVL